MSPPRSQAGAIPIGHLRAMALGLLLLQVCWILLLPPFRGMDEFDHAYRASAAAHGQIVAPPSEATRGTGAWLWIPEDIAAAARLECERLPYTTNDECGPKTPVDGMVLLASGAGRYNPAYYVSVAWVSLFLDGTQALIGMRLVTAALACALFYLAIRALASCATDRWPVIAATVAVSPVAVYSTSIVAPNGVEIMAGLATWAGLQSLIRHTPGQSDHLASITLVLGAVVLSLLRQLGPVFLVLIVALSIIAAPQGPRIAIRKLSTQLTPARVTIVAIALAAGIAWTLSNRSLSVATVLGDDYESPGETAARLPIMNLLWGLQSVAAFPFRNQSSPSVVYVAIGALWLALVAFALWKGSSSARIGVIVVLILAMTMPSAITVATYNDYADAWQGRYGLPLSVGAPILAGLSLQGRLPVGLSPRALWPAGVLFAIGHVVGAVSVLLDELRISPSVGTGQWIEPAPLAVVVTATIGALGWWAAAAGLLPSKHATEPVEWTRKGVKLP